MDSFLSACRRLIELIDKKNNHEALFTYASLCGPHDLVDRKPHVWVFRSLVKRINSAAAGGLAISNIDWWKAFRFEVLLSEVSDLIRSIGPAEPLFESSSFCRLFQSKLLLCLAGKKIGLQNVVDSGGNVSIDSFEKVVGVRPMFWAPCQIEFFLSSPALTKGDAIFEVFFSNLLRSSLDSGLDWVSAHDVIHIKLFRIARSVVDQGTIIDIGEF